MSDAREELLAGALHTIVTRDGGSEIVVYHDLTTALDAFLAHPDDLIALLVGSIGSDVLIERVKTMEREADIRSGRLVIPSRKDTDQ